MKNLRTKRILFLDRLPVRYRLAVGHALWMGILFTLAGFGLNHYIASYLRDSVDAALLTSATSLRDSRSAMAYRSPFTQSFLKEFFGERLIRPYAQLVDLSGKISARSEDFPISLPVTPNAVARAEKGLYTFETIEKKGLPPIRLITMPITGRAGFMGELVQVGAPLDSTLATLRNIRLALWTALALGLGLSIIFGYLLTARSLKPVSALTRAAAQLGSEKMSIRLPLPAAKDEMRELTETFNKMLDRLQESFERMARFSANVSHELRTPITVMRGEAEYALRKQRKPEEYVSSLKTIVHESELMSSLVEDLLLLARAERGALKLEWEPVTGDQLINSVKVATTKEIEKYQVKLAIKMPEHLILVGSHSYLTVILRNLVANAAKHSVAGQVIEIEIRENPQNFLISVKDHGTGIEEKDLPYIFDTFYRSDSARNRAQGGAGVGLSLVKALVELHGGRIRVESKVGKGAFFEMKLPKKPAHLA